jgi:molybdenum cofactor cytidylyltransferase
MTGVAAIVLAAGASRRHGSPKQLRRIAGKALVRRAADTASAAGFRPCVVVLGSSAAEIAPELAGSEADVIVNPAWSEGMASSIRAGLARVLSTAPPAEGVIVVLADQPRVGEELLRSLADRFAAGPEPVVACRYEGILGPPAIFARTLFGRLETLRGDEGARALLRSGDVPVAAVDSPEGALDIDTPEDQEIP